MNHVGGFLEDLLQRLAAQSLASRPSSAWASAGCGVVVSSPESQAHPRLWIASLHSTGARACVRMECLSVAARRHGTRIQMSERVKTPDI